MYGLLRDGNTLTILNLPSPSSQSLENDTIDSSLTLKSELKRTSLSDIQTNTICSAWDLLIKRARLWSLGLVHLPTQMYLLDSGHYFPEVNSLLIMANSIWQ